MPNHQKLYKTDSHGRTRVWWMESNDTAYRTHSGVEGGAIVTSGWKYPEAKNVGRANATTISEQVEAEVQSRYTIQQYQGKYLPEGDYVPGEGGAKFIECMLASKYEPKKHGNMTFWSQGKLDGIRCLVSEEGMQSRQGKPILSAPHIRWELEEFFAEFPDVILDGEIYADSLKDSFETIISLARKSKPTEQDLIDSAELLEYHVYDVITPEPMTYAERKAFLEKHVYGKYRMIKKVDSVEVTGHEAIEAKLGEYLEAGYEGQMLRANETPYEHKRSKTLIKHKLFEDEEFEIVEILEGQGNWASFAKALIIKLPDGSTQQSGMRGSQKFAKQLLVEKDEYVGGTVTIRYQNKTSDGKLRFPVALAFYKGVRDL